MRLDQKLLDRDPERISRMFTEVSPRYDLLNRILSLGLDGFWRRAAVKMARPAGARRILDLATGTGDLAFAFARAQDFEGEVLGLDFSGEMIRRARQKAAARGLSNRVQFREGDALDVPEPDGFFDVVACGFGVRNFEDPERGLLEAHRVLAPGGRLVVLEFFKRSEFPLIGWYMDHVLPRLGRWISRSPSAYTYLRHSTKGFLTAEDFAALLEALDFSSVDVKKLTGGIAHCIVAAKPGTREQEPSP